MERDLLIRKLFTAGQNAVAVSGSAWSATRAMFTTIWSHRTVDAIARATPEIVRSPESSVKLPAESLVILPREERAHLAEIGAQRRQMAA
jgi:hypothetical protein